MFPKSLFPIGITAICHIIGTSQKFYMRQGLNISTSGLVFFFVFESFEHLFHLHILQSTFQNNPSTKCFEESVPKILFRKLWTSTNKRTKLSWSLASCWEWSPLSSSVNFNCFQVLCFPTFKFSSIEWKALLFSISLKRVFQIKFCNFDSTTCSQQTALACLSSLWSINMYFHPHFERYWNRNIFYLSTKEKFLV